MTYTISQTYTVLYKYTVAFSLDGRACKQIGKVQDNRKWIHKTRCRSDKGGCRDY